MSTLELLRTLNAEDALVAPAVAAGAARSWPGASTSPSSRIRGRRHGPLLRRRHLGPARRLDAAELLPTFNAPAGLFVAHHAGGPAALVAAVENVEDDAELGARDAATLGPCDVVVGLTASGRTPYVAGALARRPGAGCAARCWSPPTRRPSSAADVDVLLAVDTGPEAITGSTRLKAGTAQKLVLNGFSTAVMVRLGRTWSNLMVDVVATQRQAARPRDPHPARGHRRRRADRARRRSSGPAAS